MMRYYHSLADRINDALCGGVTEIPEKEPVMEIAYRAVTQGDMILTHSRESDLSDSELLELAEPRARDLGVVLDPEEARVETVVVLVDPDWPPTWV